MWSKMKKADEKMSYCCNSVATLQVYIMLQPQKRLLFPNGVKFTVISFRYKRVTKSSKQTVESQIQAMEALFGLF